MGIDRKSSIETEPRTLNIHQIDFAREAAIYVMRTRSSDEAMKIFTEGLEPVTMGRNKDAEIEEEMEYLEDELLFPEYRDVVTAPF